MINFKCNICGTENIVDRALFNRESITCHECKSNVRFRTLAYLFSQHFSQKNISLNEHTTRKDIKGISCSDTSKISDFLNLKYDHKNTFYHKEPKLDITENNLDIHETLDFIICTDVFEHIIPPVEKGFQTLFNLLKKDGIVLFSVPFHLKSKTIEHFPSLHDWKINEINNKKILINTTKDGVKEQFDNLVFHGGDGSTLEMRLYSKDDLISQFKKAGFKDIHFFQENIADLGIFWDSPWSLPCVVYK